ncbi:uncharacterized protein LOC123664942 [Melitaea cinxia]|uniref:uncharacterized protein LOC123664942 n=1 Tax=Melitaea cinxia TaxID=113334 RepID=UPI001E2733B7|nr:uncharacterized protein LOC123664942 [Melitaea cinxia]
MSSRKTEDEHKMILDKLLSDSGIVCVRSAPESLETTSDSGADEEVQTIQEEEDKIEESVEEEMEELLVEELQEEESAIFPTPSLRRVLPDRVREIEEYNRIHVLPKEFKSDVDPTAIPRIQATSQQKCIDILGEITGCTEYRRSLAEFWFLDTLANLLRRAQNDEMDRSSQAVLILWFCEWMKEMQHFDAADRQRMLKRFQDNMLSAARFVAEEEHLPTPQEVGVFYKAVDEGKSVSKMTPESKHLVTFEGAEYECSLKDLTNIIHYIFDLFSTDYQYNLVRSVFTFSPEYKLIDAPFQMRNPKRLFAPLKSKPKKEKSPKKEKPSAKGKKKDIDTEEYLALLELRAKDEREQEEQEDKDREIWHRRNHILPLSFAADEEFFNKYWPPPPPEVLPEPEPEVKGKGKGKGKK